MNDLEDLFNPIFRTCISFIILLIVTFWLGKQVKSGNNQFNFALYITIGSFVANMGFDTNLKFFPMLALV